MVLICLTISINISKERKVNTKIKARVTTALLLAAGTGSRLYPLTKSEPKCMTSVNGKSILDRMIASLNFHGFKRLVIVTGHLESSIRNYLGNRVGDMKIEYIHSPLYKSTNNIYSLWMARKAISEPFLLLESDLIYDKKLLAKMLTPDRIAVSRMCEWMDGTCVLLNKSEVVKEFIAGSEDGIGMDSFKTVNIYSFSLESWKRIVKRLNNCILGGKVNDYYETVFADLVADNDLALKAVEFDESLWYEIDTVYDLAEAEKLFASQVLKRMKVINDAI